MTNKRPSKAPKHRIPRPATLIIALIVAVGAMFFAKKCSRPAESPFTSSLPAKSGGDTLDIAIEISPLSYSLAGDTVCGLDYDILREIAYIHGRPVKFHPFAPMGYAVRGLDEGNFDLLVSSLPSTAALKDSFALTDQVYLDREILVQQRDATKKITEAHALAGDTVWIAAGSPLAGRIRNLAAEIGDTIYIIQNHPYTSEHLVMLVGAGEIPRAVVNEGLALSMAATDARLDVATPVSFTQFQTWALRKDNTALRDTINEWLRSFRTTDRYNKLIQRYISAN